MASTDPYGRDVRRGHDADLLDFLESMATPGLLWIARQSSSGVRGFRLHQVTIHEAIHFGRRLCDETARGALEKAMKEARG